MRRAIEDALRRHGRGVRQRLAVAPLRRQRPRARVHAQALRPLPRAGRPPRGRAVAARRMGDLLRHAARCTPTSARAKAACTTRRCCWALLGWSRLRRPAEVVTPYFGSSGTGQINAVLPVTPRTARIPRRRRHRRGLPHPSRASDTCRTSSSSTRPTRAETDMTALCRAWPTPCSRRATRPASRSSRPAARACWPIRPRITRWPTASADYAFVYLNLRMGRGPQRGGEAARRRRPAGQRPRRTSRRSSTQPPRRRHAADRREPGQVFDAQVTATLPLTLSFAS